MRFRWLKESGPILSEVGLWCENLAQLSEPASLLQTAQQSGLNLYLLSSRWPKVAELLKGLGSAHFCLCVGGEDEVAPALERLGTSMVDVLLLDYPEPSDFRDLEKFQFLTRAREQGLARSVGFMARSADIAKLTHTLGFDVCLFHQNWFERDQALEVFPLAASHDVKILSGQVLRGCGLRPRVAPEVQALAEVFPEYSQHLEWLAVAYCLREKSVVSALVEADDAAQLAQLLKVTELAPLEAGDVEKLERALLGLPRG